ncbi:menaquinone-dependent protoporphyrinogen IX dehydrogenase [Ferrimonas sp. YFM]|uniref:menaquinone-dependent protoporphyrinogen IX dehydrogenase n=1 Tax=Ferrimonas sp. YFM TaxID=3028878 RepID=UPI0025747382|nr:menaquinone-dependent protoporphyrinogen IX dehydrogenase [Ferrimonas sp. YFM]BDY02977.1 protoporphyrinogen oxidase [Ferrimonas sp. YFM]
MKRFLILYMSRGGHTARVARVAMETIREQGHQCDMMDIVEATHEPVDWDSYDVVALGAPVLYGNYDKRFMQFVADHQEQIQAKPNSFFNLSVVARTPEKATVEGNRYMQKFLELSPWKPQDLKVIAGKVDYPAWGTLDTLMIQMIMKMTDGPTDKNSVIDYTDWEDVKAYGRHLITLAG